MRNQRVIAGSVLALVAAGGIVAAFGERALLAAMRRQVVATLSGATFAEFGDGLDVVLCGSGSPFPDPQRAGPCVAVVAGERIFLVDVGSGAVRNLPQQGLPPGRVEAVFLTHFHSDHIDGLGELMLQRWAGAARAEPTPVHGPPGVAQVVDGFNLAYRLDFGYRTAHHGARIVPPSGAGGRAHAFALPAAGQGVVVLDEDGLKVTAFAVSHPPIEPAVGYRFDYRGRSAVVSGDTGRSANLAHFAAGADLLVHEALAPELVTLITGAAEEAGAGDVAQITRDILDYHATPVEVAQLAQAAGVRHLLYYHVVPALPLRALERVFARGAAAAFAGGITVGRDGSWVSLPADSTAVHVAARG